MTFVFGFLGIVALLAVLVLAGAPFILSGRISREERDEEYLILVERLRRAQAWTPTEAAESYLEAHKTIRAEPSKPVLDVIANPHFGTRL